MLDDGAHFLTGKERVPLCGHVRPHDSIAAEPRRWNVAQDVGRVPLCETCKKRLRAA